MGTSTKLNGTLRRFIEAQQMFFVATADTTGRVNVSSKGMDTLRLLSDTRLLWLNLSGSGNETAAHVRATGRMTLMFCAFEGDALILRTYGTARVAHPRDADWADLAGHFTLLPGSRQIFDLTIDLVQTSCGSGVPFMDFKGPRGEAEMLPFYDEMGPEGLRDYWARKNTRTIDDTPTHIFED